jgi:hypothetical protein
VTGTDYMHAFDELSAALGIEGGELTVENEAAEAVTRIERMKAQIVAMKLRALAAHAAIWRAMTAMTPEEALRSLDDRGEVHEAVHAILAVDTESVSAPDEWRAHVERQDRRIEALEARSASIAEEAARLIEHWCDTGEGDTMTPQEKADAVRALCSSHSRHPAFEQVPTREVRIDRLTDPRHGLRTWSLALDHSLPDTWQAVDEIYANTVEYER